jgi:uncharacterized protein
MKSRALIIFVRNPELGKVKTRLARDIGDEAALTVYKKLLKHTESISLSCHATRYVFYADYINSNDHWIEPGFQKRLQSTGDLGIKMKAAFEDLLEEHEKAVIIGSDCFALQTSHIEQAFELLTRHDIVIGPAEDGGYYLLGMKKLHASLFENMVWSSETVFADTMEEIKKLQLSVQQLELLPDVDTGKDLIRFPELQAISTENLQ